MNRVLHIVEPTLESEVGHAFSFVSALCGALAESGWSVVLWAGRNASLPPLTGPRVTVVNHFLRSFRRPQGYLLCRQLLREPGRIFIPTGGRTDLALLSAASGGEPIPPGKAFLYIHWLRPDPAREAFYRRTSARQPELALLGPTTTVVETLRRWGFARASLVPYPATPREVPITSTPFRHLLCAGAARRDKGFHIITEMIRLLAEKKSDVPVLVQTSPERYRRLEPEVKEDVNRLLRIGYPHLRSLPETLAAASYEAIFAGAVCLQPYRREDFADRVSGVTLDALSLGCPVVATAGTWMAATAGRFRAGVACEPSGRGLLAAAEAVLAGYPSFQARSQAAGRVLQEEYSARHLARALTREEP